MKELIVSSVKKVGELLVSSFIQSLCDRLVVPEFLDFVGGAGLLENLEKWRKTLSTIQAMLDDADEKQYTERAVKEWLDDLRDLAYDVDDIVDELAIDASTVADNQARPSKVPKLTPSAWFIPSTSSHFMINSSLRSKIKEVTDRFNDIVTRKGQLNLNETAPDGRSYRIRGTLEPTSVMTDSHVYGREKDKEALLELLLGEKCSDAEVSVISILGMRGIGKTTLAQLLFNDEKVQSSFDLKAWACVSEDFDVLRVTKSILKSVAFASSYNNDLNLLQVELREKLKGKKFLVVLDDLWNENYHDWTILRAPFQAGAPGSTIVITTRNQGVSSTTGTIPGYYLQVLSNNACLSVFTQHALGTSDFSTYPELQDIGEKIIERCKGLPLAAKTLGGLLRTTLDHDEWEDVLKSKIWDIPEGRSRIVPALLLSYSRLPSHLKRCFAYCSIFPKDYEFEEEQLVLLWMAEGLIQPLEGDKKMEDLGRKHFRNLLSRSFFQQSSTEKSRFVMHDLINDLAQWVAADTCFRMEDKIGGSNGKRLPKKARHSSYLGDQYDSTRKFEVFYEFICLRTFLPLMLPSHSQCYLTHNVPLQLLPKLQCLRVLSLNGYCIVELPDSIGGLKHLRYLDLSYTRIRGLPESTTTLYNLQTLILKKCPYLKELPSKLGNLVNLRHLNILHANKLKGMPPQIGKLTSLQTLSNLIVGKGNCFALKELGYLLHLQGTLIISRLENVIEPREARDAKLIEKTDLIALCLEWSVDVDGSQDRTSESEILNMLQPNKALKELTIMHYGGTKFPTWLIGHSFPHIVLLRIENCRKCASLPPVGQLSSLKHLFIEGMASVKNIGVEIYGDSCSQPFESLETLCFKNMEEWEDWSPNGEFPQLRELSIENCPKLLGALPKRLPLLKKLLVDNCQRLVVSDASFLKLCELKTDGLKDLAQIYKVEFSPPLSRNSEFTCRIQGYNIEKIAHARNLVFINCEELTHLGSNYVRFLQTLQCLLCLSFSHCENLVSLMAEEVREQQLGFPFSLRQICFSYCNALESLPNAVMCNNTCLESIIIRVCDSLKHFAIGTLPPTVKRLRIQCCKNMVILVDEDDTNNCSSSTCLLGSLEISGCPSFKSITASGELPATLKRLNILKCEKLESVAKSFHHNSSLETIHIETCENLKSLPMGIHTLSHLRQFYIKSCSTLVSFLSYRNWEQIEALPNCIHNITFLQELKIEKCPFNVSFPEEGFPANLRTLEIMDYNITEALLDWGLHKLTSLRNLEIGGGCPHLVSFPEMMLPASLQFLSIQHFPNLKYLSSEGFQSLDSLETLRIHCCEKLMSFPKDGLPPSLQQLYIRNCSLLKEHCKKDQGREWFKIAHIPRVEIDDIFIYDPAEENQ